MKKLLSNSVRHLKNLLIRINYHTIKSPILTFVRINQYLGISQKEARRRYKANRDNHAIWEKDVKRFENMYDTIHIYGTHDGRIGETISAYVMHRYLFNVDRDLKLLISENDKEENHRLLQVFNRKINTISDFNYDYWIYILKKLRRRIVIDKNHMRTCMRSEYCDRIVSGIDTVPLIKLNYNEMVEAQEKLGQYNLSENYVCLYNRDAAYLSTRPEDSSYHDFRNSSIKSLYAASDYLAEKGISSVRMGKITSEKADNPNIWDYSNEAWDELLDIYLMQNCKFVVGDESGILLLARASNIPVLETNVAGIVGLSFPFVPQQLCDNKKTDLFIPMKYWSVNEKRYLSLEESFEADIMAGVSTTGYEKLGIKIEHNTEREILDAVEEMNNRINGTWIESEEDIAYQTKFQSIMNGMYFNKTGVNGIFTAKIGAKYLRDNLYLIETQ